jgi:diaminopimelate epimerase
MQITKYSANGNDFVLFHTFVKKDFTKLAVELCDRFSGVGADGLIVLIPHDEYDFEWLFYNADGSYAAMCGNGSRACAHYAFNEGLAPNKMAFLTGAGVIHAEVKEKSVDSELTKYKIFNDTILELGREWFSVDTGVPHLVTTCENIEDFNKELCAKMRYQHNANVNYVALVDNTLQVRTYERGVEDETLACGTGMAACFLKLYLEGKVGNEMKVYPTSKEEVVMRIEEGKLHLEGSVTRTFELIKNL